MFILLSIFIEFLYIQHVLDTLPVKIVPFTLMNLKYVFGVFTRFALEHKKTFSPYFLFTFEIRKAVFFSCFYVYFRLVRLS